MSARETTAKVKRELARKNNQELAREISDNIQPFFNDMVKVLRKRLSGVEDAIEAIDVPDKVSVSNAVSIKDPISITGLERDPAFKNLVTELQNVVVAVNDIPKPESFDELQTAIGALEAPLTPLSEQLNELYSLISDVAERETAMRLLSYGEADPDKFIPVRLTNGKEFYQAISGGSGGSGVMYGEDINGGGLKPIAVVESQDNAGVFGMVVLNPDGSTLSTGNGPGNPDALVDNIEIQNGDDLLLQNGDFLLTQ